MAFGRRWSGAWTLALALLAQPVRAAPLEPGVEPGATPAAAADIPVPFYPFPARLKLDPGTLQATHEHPRDSFGSAPLVRPSTTRLGLQAVRACAVMLDRLFRPAVEGVTDLELEVSLVEAKVGLDADGWLTSVGYLAVLRTAGGAELGRWSAEGRARIVGPSVAAIPRAFEQAAAAAARQLELLVEVEASRPWVRWLAGRGFDPAGQAGVLETRRRQLEASRPRPPPPRAARVWFVEGGSALVVAGSALAVSGGARAGWSGERLAAAASLEVWPATFLASPDNAWGKSAADLTITEVGFELAWPLRLGSDVEFRLGGAVHLLYGQGRTTYLPLDEPSTRRNLSFSGVHGAGSLVAGGRYVSTLEVLGGRARLGLDLRRHLGATLHLTSAGRDLPVIEWSLALTLGLEWPAAWSPFGR